MAFHLDPNGLAETMKDLRDFEAWCEQATTRIHEVVTGLHTTWTGKAADEQAEAHRLWRDGEAKMREALARLHTAGSQAHSNHTAAGDHGTQMWQI